MVGDEAEEGLQGLRSVLSTLKCILKELNVGRDRIRLGPDHCLRKEAVCRAKGRRSWQAARAVVHVGGLAK